VESNSLFFYGHRCFHDVFFGAVCLVMGHQLRSKLLIAIGKHIALDYMTHKKGWLHGHTEVYCNKFNMPIRCHRR
jgi:hypothetical protein